MDKKYTVKWNKGRTTARAHFTSKLIVKSYVALNYSPAGQIFNIEFENGKPKAKELVKVPNSAWFSCGNVTKAAWINKIPQKIKHFHFTHN